MDARIRKSLDYIENQLSVRLTLKDIAQVACMSPAYFHRTFKKETGRTPFAFIEEIKMNKAYQMLISGSCKVYELTNRFGYNDYETFSRAFKKHHILAPDDLKAIAHKIKSEMKVGPEDLIIEVFEVDKINEVKDALEQIVNQLKDLLIDRGYSEDDIKKAKVMSVMPKLVGAENQGNVIKNKFVVAENQKIWKVLLNFKQNGNS